MYFKIPSIKAMKNSYSHQVKKETTLYMEFRFFFILLLHNINLLLCGIHLHESYSLYTMLNHLFLLSLRLLRQDV